MPHFIVFLLTLIFLYVYSPCTLTLYTLMGYFRRRYTINNTYAIDTIVAVTFNILLNKYIVFTTSLLQSRPN